MLDNSASFVGKLFVSSDNFDAALLECQRTSSLGGGGAQVRVQTGSDAILVMLMTFMTLRKHQ